MLLQRKIIALLMLVCLALSGCSAVSSPASMIKPPVSVMASPVSGEKVSEIVNKFLPKGAQIINPNNPAGSKGIQSIDIDGDGKNEITALYKLSDDQKQAGLIVLKQAADNSWNKIFEYKSEGFSVNYFNFADITGDKKKDLLVGWSIGSTASGLDVFSFQNNQLKKIASDYYSKIDVEDMPDKDGKADGKNEIALWMHDTGEAYKIDVFRWDGTKLVPAVDVYPYYFKKVVPFYEQRVKEMPTAAFYWYYLADAQIKANDPSAALASIKTGLSIKEKNPSYYPKNTEFEKLQKTAQEMLSTKQ